MIDLAQMFAKGQIVEAHDKKWVTLYLVNSNDTHTYYMACEVEAQCPAEVKLIAVTKEWENANLAAQLAALKASKDKQP